MSESAKLDRMLALMAWLRELGVCACCRVAFAIRQVERETGGEKMLSVPCERRPVRDMTCRDIARERWAEMPAKLAER